MVNHIAELLADTLESNYKLATSIDHRKKYAQFFTPEPIAEIMVKWLAGNASLRTVLEPAFGLGVFSRILLRDKKEVKITAYETDPKIFGVAKDYFINYPNVSLKLKDYIFNDWENKYDGIICNPPYFRFQNYDNKGFIYELEQRLNYDLSGFSNLYALFLLKAITQIKPGGRIAFIIPSEFLNSDYGVKVKSYLVKSKLLRHVFIIHFDENVFEDALTTASIILLANDGNDNIHFTNITKISDLTRLEDIIMQYPLSSGDFQFTSDELDPKKKWRFYYQNQNTNKYKKLVPFSKYAKVQRGIATGSNEYFTFNRSKAEYYKINRDCLLPCICRSADIKGAFFTIDNFEQLKKDDKSVFLFNAKSIREKCVSDYIQFGEINKVNEKHLTANRTPWYALEKRAPAPIWVSVFNRNGLRFIRNEANISNLTTFHCIYLNLFSLPITDLFFAYLLTDISNEILNDNRREYGNGLQKFEPNDLNKSLMLDLEQLNKVQIEKILELYNLYRISEINNQPQYHLIDNINSIFKEVFSN